MAATKQARNIQGSQQNGRENNFYRAHNKMVEQTHLYRDYQHQEYHEDKVHPRVLSISKATRPSRRLICSLFLSVHAIPEKLAQRLLVSGLSVGQSPFSLSRLIYDEYNNPLVTCVYIEPVPCLGVCAAKQFVTSRDPRLPREWAAGRRQKHIHFLRQDAQGGVETTNNRTKMYNRTIAMTLSLLY